MSSFYDAVVCKMNDGKLISYLLELRCAVGALGETHHWWRSTFLSPTGLSFLQRIYPRTFVAAAIRSATQVAQREHDARIGRGQVVHLFRLPQAFERAIDDALREWDPPAQERQRERLATPEGPTAILRELATASKEAGLEGPINCGDVSQLNELPAIERLAGQYLQSFEQGRKVFPFFEVGGQR